MNNAELSCPAALTTSGERGEGEMEGEGVWSVWVESKYRREKRRSGGGGKEEWCWGDLIKWQNRNNGNVGQRAGKIQMRGSREQKKRCTTKTYKVKSKKQKNKREADSERKAAQQFWMQPAAATCFTVSPEHCIMGSGPQGRSHCRMTSPVTESAPVCLAPSASPQREKDVDCFGF